MGEIIQWTNGRSQEPDTAYATMVPGNSKETNDGKKKKKKTGARGEGHVLQPRLIGAFTPAWCLRARHGGSDKGYRTVIVILPQPGSLRAFGSGGQLPAALSHGLTSRGQSLGADLCQSLQQSDEMQTDVPI